MCFVFILGNLCVCHFFMLVSLCLFAYVFPCSCFFVSLQVSCFCLFLFLCLTMFVYLCFSLCSVLRHVFSSYLCLSGIYKDLLVFFVWQPDVFVTLYILCVSTFHVFTCLLVTSSILYVYVHLCVIMYVCVFLHVCVIIHMCVCLSPVLAS